MYTDASQTTTDMRQEDKCTDNAPEYSRHPEHTHYCQAAFAVADE
jgi:hypothetical protein